MLPMKTILCNLIQPTLRFGSRWAAAHKRFFKMQMSRATLTNHEIAARHARSLFNPNNNLPTPSIYQTYESLKGYQLAIQLYLSQTIVILAIHDFEQPVHHSLPAK